MKEERQKKVVAIVVTYNRKELLKECVNALLNQEYQNCDILIVDNASTDGTKEYINEELGNEKVHYVNTGANLGGAGGFNYGMKEAYKIGCDFIWIMDDDCIVHKNSLSELMKANEELKGDFGFLSSKVLWKDNSICTMNIQKRKFSKWLKDFNTNKQTIAMASFVSLFLKTSVVEELGLPIKEFFIWTDDWEYTRRISRKYKCYYISKSVVTHKSRNNEGASIDSVDGDRLDRFKYMYRNDVVLYRREGFIGWILLYMRLILHKLRILKSNKKDKKVRISIINNSIKEGRNFYPSIEYLSKDNKIRVLQVFGEPLANGGQEAFVMNMYEKIDRERVQFDFFTPFYCNNIKMKERIEMLGGKVFVGNGKFETKFRKRNFKKNFKDFIKSNQYDIVHINSGSAYELAYGAEIAKRYNVKKIIVHAHSVTLTNGIKNKVKSKILKAITGKKFLKNTDIYLACSDLTAKSKFPSVICDNKKYIVFKNGIDTEKFKYDEEIRNKYRREMQLEGKKVICHIGRFQKQKNQAFIIKLFEQIHRIDKNTELILVGDGEDKEIIVNLIKEYKLEDSIKLLGIRNDVYNILQAADLFIFPSIFEGFGIVAIEAQATGLPIICSTAVPNEANITDLFYSLELKNFDEWVNLATEILKRETKREDMSKVVESNGYNSKYSAKKLLEIYLTK